MNDDSCDTLSGPAQTDGYVYTVCVSSNPQYRGSGENPASLYRHKIDCWTPRRVFVMKRQEGVGDNRATKWAREQEGRWALDREELEREGEIWHSPARGRLYLHREDAEATVEKHAPAIPDCLEALGLDRSATARDVRTAFRSQSKKLHPDAGGTKEDFQRLRTAYEDALEEV